MRRSTMRRLVGVALMAPLATQLALGAAGATPATPEEPVRAAAAGGGTLGGYTLTARANGVGIVYDMPGALPIGTLVDLGAPEAQTRLASGPVGSAISGAAYPGPVILGGETLLEQGGFAAPFDIPDYPFVIRASSSGPVEASDDQTAPGTTMYAKADGATVEARTVTGAGDADPVLTIGGIATRATGVVEGTADTASFVELSDIVALGGLLRIESITTDLAATSDGAAASSTGKTVVSGATIVGEPVTIGPDGIRFDDPPEGTEPPTGGVLGQIGQQLEPVSAGLGDLLDQAGSLNELLGEAGISIRLAEPRATGTGAAAERVSQGLAIEFEQELGATPLADLFDLIPVLPDLPGAPVGPNDLVQILQSRQVSSITLGGAEVAASASPGFEPPEFEVNIDTPPTPAPPVAQGPSLSSRGPSSSPAVTTAPTAGTVTDEVATGPISTEAPFALPGVIGPGMIFAAVVGALVLSLGSRRLPDWAIDGGGVAAAAGACDDPPDLQRGDGT